MTPYTLADAEAELRAALDTDNPDAALLAAAMLDQLPTPTPVTILSAALWYAQHGLPVLPLTPRSKVPHKGTRGSHDATLDEDTIRAWWRRWPNSNVGIATGHLIDVVDFDGRDAHIAWGEKFGDTYANLTVLGTVSTPRPGGLHLYVPARPGMGNKARLLDGVDYRGRGGFVVAPPSVTDVGSYHWLRPLDLGAVA